MVFVRNCFDCLGGVVLLCTLLICASWELVWWFNLI